ncbi:MAG TPA: hypothetical protein VIV63_00645 [Steroidobacteraceae bacterium]
MITDDELILYYYRDGLDAAERARIGKMLSEHPELAQRMQGLVAHLDAAAALPEVPVPAQTRQRWQAALERAAQTQDPRNVAAPRAGRGFFTEFRWPVAAATAAVIAFIVIVRMPTPTLPDQTAEVAAPADSTAYERGLKLHLASTERQLAGLENTDPKERARLIETIVAQNRMYALAAERAGEPQLARVLRAFAPILESLEHEGGESSASIAQLNFELRIMQGRLGAGGSSTNNPSTTL